MNKDTTLTKRDILRIFKRNGYTKAQFARDNGVHRSAVSQFFKNQSTSARLEAAAQEKAQELLEQEKKQHEPAA